MSDRGTGRGLTRREFIGAGVGLGLAVGMPGARAQERGAGLSGPWPKYACDSANTARSDFAGPAGQPQLKHTVPAAACGLTSGGPGQPVLIEDGRVLAVPGEASLWCVDTGDYTVSEVRLSEAMANAAAALPPPEAALAIEQWGRSSGKASAWVDGDLVTYDFWSRGLAHGTAPAPLFVSTETCKTNYARSVKGFGVGPDGALYLPDATGLLHCYRVGEGTRWSASCRPPNTPPNGDWGAGTWITGCPAVSAEGIVYAATWYSPDGRQSDGELIAYAPDGAVLWRVVVGPTSMGPAISADGAIYCGNAQRLVAVSAAGEPQGGVELAGKALWSDASLALAADGSIRTLVRTGQNYRFASYSPDGTQLWWAETESAYWMSSGLTLDRDGVCYALVDELLVALDAQGQLRWSLPIDVVPDDQVAALDDGRRVVTGSGTHYLAPPVLGSDGTLYLSIKADNPIPSGVQVVGM